MALLERIAEAALTWKTKFSSWQLAKLMRAFATFRLEQTEGVTAAMQALSDENASRLKELSTKREDVFYAGACQRWHEVYTAGREEKAGGEKGGGGAAAGDRSVKGLFSSWFSSK